MDTVFENLNPSNLLLQNNMHYWFSLLSIGILTIFLYVIYRITVYPRYISSLRHIPGPPSENWLLGALGRVYREEAGSLYQDWIHEVGSA